MTARTVTTQAELDQALADQVEEITIDSPRGVRLSLSASASASVRAWMLWCVAFYAVLWGAAWIGGRR